MERASPSLPGLTALGLLRAPKPDIVPESERNPEPTQPIDVLKMPVKDLRAALAQRGLETKGLKKVLQHTPALMCEVDGYEGDDVIAALVTRFRDFYQLEILSTDGDLLALTDHPNVTSIRKPYDGIPAERVRLFKTICGDTSDNISGIPGVGPKTFAKLNHVALTHWLEGKRVLSYGATGAQEDFYMPPKIAEWTAENEELLKAYWAITGFFPVPDITSHVKRGTPDAAAANALMKEYLL